MREQDLGSPWHHLWLPERSATPIVSQRCVNRTSHLLPVSSGYPLPDTPFTAGLAVCYDLRFPELFRALVEKGADLIFLPAAFTLATGRDHWEVLLRARAIENQAYVVAPAQWGRHSPGRRSYGRSLIVDPWGVILAQAPDGEGLILADLDHDRLSRLRREMPCWQHRRLC